MRTRRPGLQERWSHIVNALQEIIPSYEKASSRISLFADHRMRPKAVAFAVGEGSLVLDLGAGPGNMSRLVARYGGFPVLLDVSRTMLRKSSFENRVQAVFEYLPFKPESFDAVVSGFAVRDSVDLLTAVGEVASALKRDGRFSFCDLGKPDSEWKALPVAFYLRVAPAVIGMATGGSAGRRYASLFDTYMLTLRNSQLTSLLSRFFTSVDLHEDQLGGSIVVECRK